MEKWVNKIAVVTGASAGIGQNVAQKLVEEGMQVVGLARRVERVEELSKNLSGKFGKLHAFKCDVSNEDEVKNAFQWIKEKLGPVSILINNAGTVINNSFIDGDPKIWKYVLDVNLIGTALCAQQAVLQMKEANIAGHIININSIVGHKIIDSTQKDNNVNIYPSSKHGITAYTEVMRQEMRNQGLKIKITSISPGMVHTEIFKVSNMNLMTDEIINQLPHLLPEDVTDAIVYVLGTKPHVQIHEMIIKPIGEAF